MVIPNTYTCILSQFVYLMSVLPSPPVNIFKEIEQIIFDFIWNGKKDKIKRQILYYSKEKGGLGVPNIYIKNKALKLGSRGY